MPEVSARCYDIADSLLDFLGLGEPTLLVPRPQGLPVDADFKDAAGRAGYQRHFGKFSLEGRQQLLREPGCAQKPATACAILDLNSSALTHDYPLPPVNLARIVYAAPGGIIADPPDEWECASTNCSS